MLPTYLIIGTGRAATTWTHECLAEHPQVFTPATKELHFFSAHYERGREFYESFFEPAQQGNYMALGEASPTYLADKDAAARIHEMLPKVKLIAILRNPIERAFSQFCMFQLSHPETTFEEAIEQRPALLSDGLYARHLERYRRRFSSEQLLILLLEDIEANALEFIQGIYHFIGVDQHYVPGSLERPVNISIDSRLESLLAVAPVRWLVTLLRRTALDGAARRFVLKRKAKSGPKIEAATRRRLQGYYAEENERLAEMLGRDLGHWT